MRVHSNHLNSASKSGQHSADQLGAENDSADFQSRISGKARIGACDLKLSSEFGLVHEQPHQYNHSNHNKDAVVGAGSLNQLSEGCRFLEADRKGTVCLIQEEGTDQPVSKIKENVVHHKRNNKLVGACLFLNNNRNNSNNASHQSRCSQND